MISKKFIETENGYIEMEKIVLGDIIAFIYLIKCKRDMNF